MTTPRLALLFALAAAACEPMPPERMPSTAFLDGSNPYLAYPEGGAIGCQRTGDKLLAVRLTPEDGIVCLPISMMGRHVAPLTDLQRCREGEHCVPCEGDACSPAACFPPAPLVPLDDANCWLPLEADAFLPATDFVALQLPPAGSPPPAASPDDVPLLPQVLIVSPSAEVQITSDPLHATFLLGRFGPRFAGDEPPPGGDCDSGNCGVFPVFQSPEFGAGFRVRGPDGVRRWQGSPF